MVNRTVKRVLRKKIANRTGDEQSTEINFEMPEVQNSQNENNEHIEASASENVQDVQPGEVSESSDENKEKKKPRRRRRSPKKKTAQQADEQESQGYNQEKQVEEIIKSEPAEPAPAVVNENAAEGEKAEESSEKSEAAGDTSAPVSKSKSRRRRRSKYKKDKNQEQAAGENRQGGSSENTETANEKPEVESSAGERQERNSNSNNPNNNRNNNNNSNNRDSNRDRNRDNRDSSRENNRDSNRDNNRDGGRDSNRDGNRDANVNREGNRDSRDNNRDNNRDDNWDDNRIVNREPGDKSQRRDMLINVAAGQECRIAVMQEKKLEELYVERLDTTSLVGNIYKGKIVNVEPSIQACFVDFGIGQNGFLHISDVQTAYFKNSNENTEKVGKKQPRKERPLIQECLKKGQEVVVQVIKAGIGTKGPTLSSYISIPGRYVVLMPGMKHSGVSRKLTQEDRQKMKELSAELDAPEDVGIILRTASLGSNKRDLKKDFNYLLRLWKQMSHSIKKKSGPMELYKESDLVIRTIRDVFTTGIDRIYCDNEDTWQRINDFFAIAMPRSRNKVKLYTDHVPIFSKYNIEREIEKLQGKSVPLPHGGSIVIESTEAMVTIDVNSGKYRDNNNAEDTAYKTNIEAADEICRQLKLRDLGGVIVIDFIDMVNSKHKRELEKVVRDLFTKDRASTRILRINQFGLMAITRQRMKASLKNRTYVSCPHCKGTGHFKSAESVSIEVMRKIAYAAEEPQVAELDVIVSPEVSGYLLNDRRKALVDLENKHSTRIKIKSDSNIGPEDVAFEARNGRGIRIEPWL